MFRHKTVFIWLLIATITFTGVFLNRNLLKNVNAGETDHYERIKTFTETLSLIKTNYVEEVDEKDLVYGAIKGMLNSLDPHSSFMTPEYFKEMQIDTKGEFGGLGIQIGIKDNILTIIAPIDDTPAFKAGVKAGDKIIKIDGDSTKDITIHDAVSKLRGQKGTSVTITIVREELEKPLDIEIVRDIIKLKSVKHKIIDENIGYIKLTQFQEKTSADLRNALEEIAKKNINALILDLRNNPGGLLKAAVDVSSLFLPSEKLVVYIKGRSGDKTEFKTARGNRHFDYPMVVLVNQGSASASEIVAGAMQDWKQAVILGTQTFGKGSVQTVIPLSDGSALRLTTARYYTPKDRSIQTTGITPDIIVELKTTNGAKMHPVYREKDLDKHLKNDTTKEEEVSNTSINPKVPKEVPSNVSEDEDNQLQRAVDLLKGWRVFKKFPEAS
ncbi:carboxy-terminal processing protease CtpB precursor [bacterium BMS3Abin09]|nr:carboxy-terminal processing protease CtpB precursor [bacterium BMS3Abin09]GBE41850.1 carboxy-terminal processing protease CtpB precursor [bacterium BMS3Bbin09]HDN95371.1 S41 family peptidase [Nitrospirota bacterium]HDO66886.1 S41 family peptidase [Nitrospirota bacterium]HEW81060.1 S41 family peptidase [Nitrospirota bacterium]